MDLEARLKGFQNHKSSEGAKAAMATLRGSYLQLVIILHDSVPECREKSLAFTALEESLMWAIKGLTLTDPFGKVME